MEAVFENSHPYFANFDLRVMFFEALLQPPRAYPGVKPTYQHVVTCMQVCKAWCKQGVGLIWTDIGDYQTSLETVLYQFSPDQQAVMADSGLTWKVSPANFLKKKESASPISIARCV